MKALQLTKPEQWRLLDLAEPAAPGPGQALVGVHNVGICGTDLSGYLGKMPFFTYPRIPGHELGVEVLAVGADVTNVRVGDRCAVEPYLNCGQCSACRRGHGNCCEDLQVLGVMIDGGLTERLVVPARKLHPAAKLSFEQLALVETLAIGCHAIHRAAPQPDESLLVIGAGPIGLSVLEFAKLSGARPIVMDLNPQRLEFCAQQMGVEHRLLVRGDGTEAERLRQLTRDGALPAVVVDATGNAQSMSQALHYVGFAGRLVYVGITREELRFAHGPLMHRRELTLLASRNALPEDFRRIIGLIESGRLDTRPWITHRAALDQLPEVFPSYLRPETGVVKAMVAL
jgi:alcohol dehydrogenase